MRYDWKLMAKDALGCVPMIVLLTALGLTLAGLGWMTENYPKIVAGGLMTLFVGFYVVLFVWIVKGVVKGFRKRYRKES